MVKKLWQAVAVSCALWSCVSLSGCGPQDAGGNKVYFAAHADATGFTGLLFEGVKAKLSSQGVDVEFLNANGDVNMQIDQLNEAIEQKPAAIVLLPVDGYAVIPVVEKVNAVGIPLIATNRDLNGGRFAHVASDEVQAGRLQGEYMAKHLPPDAQLVYLMGESSQKSAIARWEGFKEACLDKRPDIKLLAKADAGWSETEGLKYMTLWLQLFPKIDAVVSGNDNMSLGALRALQAAGREKGVLISGVDATPEALNAVAAGTMSQTVKQDDDKTAEAIAGLLQASLSGTMSTEEVKIPLKEITKDNIAQFK